MALPLNVKFTTTTTDYDLLQDENIVLQIKGQLGEYAYDNLLRDANSLGVFTVFIDSPTQIKFKDDGVWNDFIADMVYSSNGTNLPSKLIIKDTGITGLLSLQIQ